MAVATYKREDYALELLKHFHFDQYCEPMHGADNLNVLKKEDIVNLCIHEMNASREECVLVGDTEHDALGAVKAGVAFLAVTYGFGFQPGEKLPSDCSFIGVADTTTDIVKILMDGGKTK